MSNNNNRRQVFGHLDEECDDLQKRVSLSSFKIHILLQEGLRLKKDIEGEMLRLDLDQPQPQALKVMESREQ